ncbi:alpha/beta fold hydrolase [Mucilaginibacter segetis]|uniref:Alpha/beta hydrolase n=1 Tax=Mucilaginibacter segetis TaxID=2793071 RepID=A0A934PRU7_9SPHI|nr:alpha/beta hydrolase [Mucilaginibacter segetis]MBK0377803.1 alpha/beta hydrolase [Mucilaginibacter segetis]
MKTPLFFLLAIFMGITACNNDRANSATKTVNNIPVENNGVHIDYTDTGKGDTTLLFVHGWCINKTYWDNQVDCFNKNYRVVTIDLPGFGKSGKNRRDFNTTIYATDVNAIINQLHLNNVVLIGHSMSGDIILQAAVTNAAKVIGIVGIDNFKSVGVQMTNEKQAEKEYAEAMAAMKKDFKSVAIPYFNDQLFYKTTSAAVRQRIINDVKHADTIVAVKAMVWDKFNEADKLITYGKKLYMLNSDYDPTDVSGLKTKHLPYDLTYIHATGHFPMVEKPNEFNKLLEGIIKRI